MIVQSWGVERVNSDKVNNMPRLAGSTRVPRYWLMRAGFTEGFVTPRLPGGYANCRRSPFGDRSMFARLNQVTVLQ